MRNNKSRRGWRPQRSVCAKCSSVCQSALAAPILINGKRGNVAVVVQQKGKNKYHVHRILMPDGSKFVYENIQQNAEPTGDSIARKESRKGLSISSASNNSIPQNSEKSTPTAQENFDKVRRSRTASGDVVTISKGELAERKSGV